MSKTTTVYRVCKRDSAAIGPFQDMRRVSAHVRRSEYRDEWCAPPSPWHDEGLSEQLPGAWFLATLEDGTRPDWGVLPKGSVVCGFASREQAMKWLNKPGMWRELDEDGFVVRAFKVPADRVKVGKHQVIFDRTKARCVKKYRPTAFLASSNIH